MSRPAVRGRRVRPGILVRMCGIVGYIGQPQSDREHGALDVLMEGLRRLEYRGYDSAGVAVVDGGQLYHRKKAGKLANLAEELAEQQAKIVAATMPGSATGTKMRVSICIQLAPSISAARARHFTGDVLPTHTVIGVAALARPQFLVEISAIAHLG